MVNNVCNRAKESEFKHDFGILYTAYVLSHSWFGSIMKIKVLKHTATLFYTTNLLVLHNFYFIMKFKQSITFEEVLKYIKFYL